MSEPAEGWKNYHRRMAVTCNEMMTDGVDTYVTRYGATRVVQCLRKTATGRCPIIYTNTETGLACRTWLTGNNTGGSEKQYPTPWVWPDLWLETGSTLTSLLRNTAFGTIVHVDKRTGSEAPVVVPVAADQSTKTYDAVDAVAALQFAKNIRDIYTGSSGHPPLYKGRMFRQNDFTSVIEASQGVFCTDYPDNEACSCLNPVQLGAPWTAQWENMNKVYGKDGILAKHGMGNAPRQDWWPPCRPNAGIAYVPFVRSGMWQTPGSVSCSAIARIVLNNSDIDLLEINQVTKCDISRPDPTPLPPPPPPPVPNPNDDSKDDGNKKSEGFPSWALYGLIAIVLLITVIVVIHKLRAANRAVRSGNASLINIRTQQPLIKVQT